MTKTNRVFDVKNLNNLNAYRVTSPEIIATYGSAGDDTAGVFRVRSCIDMAFLFVIASNAEGWDHVSTSRQKRPPNWREMVQIKRMFFKDDETAVQYHVPPSEHVNNHPYCLHLWRPHDVEMPRPPEIFV